MSDTPLSTFRKARRWLGRVGVVALAGAAGVGIALRAPADPDPATPAQQAAARAFVRCPPGQDLCLMLQRFAAPAVCAALMSDNGGEPKDPGLCPGDAGFSAPVVAQRDRRFLDCAKREEAIETWHAFASPTTPGVCGVELRMNRPQAVAWINRLDAAQVTTLVNVRRSQRPADLLQANGDLVSVWADVDPADEADDAAAIDVTDPLDGGVP